MSVIDLNVRLATKRKQEQHKEMLEVVKGLMKDMSQYEKEKLFEAIDNRDMDMWKRITEPVIRRQVIKAWN
ncbi:hypothetical protein [Halobacillus sp. H74]|uniref:hypothetical protein n=1 Tax=Halobacillus sp. H74 TaxID=3457436 RepID=UPI003FCE9635